MEKKTLTSLAIITFLMSSTAVIAMGDDLTDSNPLAGPPVKIETAEREDPSTSSAVTPAKNDDWSFFWPPSWFSKPAPSVEGREKDGANTLLNASTKESPGESPSSTSGAPVKVALQDFHMGQSSLYTTSGFSALESSHRWTEGNNASITIPLGEMEPRPTSISFLNTGAFVTPNHSQKLTVKVNGVKVDDYDYTHTNNDQRIDITLPKDDPLATIEFETLNAITPSALGLNNPDKRKLGILLRGVQFQISTPSGEEIPGDNANNIPSSAPAEGLGESSKSLGGVIPTEDDFITNSVSLDPERFQQLLKAGRSANAGNLEEAKSILSSPTSSTFSAETTPKALTTEERGWLSSLYHVVFG